MRLIGLTRLIGLIGLTRLIGQFASRRFRGAQGRSTHNFCTVLRWRRVGIGIGFGADPLGIETLPFAIGSHLLQHRVNESCEGLITLW